MWKYDLSQVQRNYKDSRFVHLMKEKGEKEKKEEKKEERKGEKEKEKEKEKAEKQVKKKEKKEEKKGEKEKEKAEKQVKKKEKEEGKEENKNKKDVGLQGDINFAIYQNDTNKRILTYTKSDIINDVSRRDIKKNSKSDISDVKNKKSFMDLNKRTWKNIKIWSMKKNNSNISNVTKQTELLKTNNEEFTMKLEMEKKRSDNTKFKENVVTSEEVVKDETNEKAKGQTNQEAIEETNEKTDEKINEKINGETNEEAKELGESEKEKEKEREKEKEKENGETNHTLQSNIEEGDEPEEYTTYCNDGFLRTMLKNAAVSSSTNIFLKTPIISFLNEEERTRCALTCKLLFFEIYSLNNLKNLYKNKFISYESRSFIWRALLLPEKTYMDKELFETLKKKESPFEKIIEKDLHRTFPKNPHFSNDKTNMQKQLYNILKVSSLYLKKVGYCQGMNYMAGIFLLLFQNELNAMRCFLSLLINYNFKDMFVPNFPELKNCIFQLSILLKAYVPKLFYYLKKKKIKIDFFCVNWFMTLFSLDLKYRHTIKLWDQFFLFGWKIVMKFSLAILHHYQRKIINLPYDEALTFLKSLTKQKFINYLFTDNNFFTYLKKFKITNRLLRQIQLLKENNEKINIQVIKIGDQMKCTVSSKGRTGTTNNKDRSRVQTIESSNFLFDTKGAGSKSVWEAFTDKASANTNNDNISSNKNNVSMNRYSTYGTKYNSHNNNSSSSNSSVKEKPISFFSEMKRKWTNNIKYEHVDSEEKGEELGTVFKNSLIETNIYTDFHITRSFE